MSVYSLASVHVWHVLPLVADGADTIALLPVSGPKVLNFDISPVTFPSG